MASRAYRSQSLKPCRHSGLYTWSKRYWCLARSSGVLHTRTMTSQYSWVSSVIGTYHSYCTM
ncbi:hypothetical protein D3C78_1430720 [compost metagenome]